MQINTFQKAGSEQSISWCFYELAVYSSLFQYVAKANAYE